MGFLHTKTMLSSLYLSKHQATNKSNSAMDTEVISYYLMCIKREWTCGNKDDSVFSSIMGASFEGSTFTHKDTNLP